MILLLDVVIDLIRALVREPVLRGLDMAIMDLDLVDTTHLMDLEDITVIDHIDLIDLTDRTDHIMVMGAAADLL